MKEAAEHQIEVVADATSSFGKGINNHLNDIAIKNTSLSYKQWNGFGNGNNIMEPNIG